MLMLSSTQASCNPRLSCSSLLAFLLRPCPDFAAHLFIDLAYAGIALVLVLILSSPVASPSPVIRFLSLF